MEVVGCSKARESSCTLRPAAMLFHGISGDHIQGIMEEMERRSKTDGRLAKGVQMNGRETVSFDFCPPHFLFFARERERNDSSISSSPVIAACFHGLAIMKSTHTKIPLKFSGRLASNTRHVLLQFGITSRPPNCTKLLPT